MKDQIPLDIAQDKPPYRIPSMDEIRAIPWNGLSMVSTFSGCGGSCLGFKMAGFKVLWASEFVPAAQETYRANHPDTHLDTRDIRDVKPEEILAVTGLERGQLDVFEGSPPCASFSMSGNREADWGKVKKYSDVEQRTDDLFLEYVRLLDGLRPKVFVAENVPGLTVGDHKKGDEPGKKYAVQFLEQIRRALCLGGDYIVWDQILNAVRYGVPQHRRRLIFIGVRRDLGRLPAFPRPHDHDSYSIKDALGDVIVEANDNVKARIARGSWSGGGIEEIDTDGPIGTVTASGISGVAMHEVEVSGDGLADGARRLYADPEEPAPVIMAEGMGGVNRYQAELGEPGEGTKYRRQLSPKTRTLQADVDEPARTIMAHGMGDVKSHQVEIDPADLQEGSIEGYAIGDEWDRMEEGDSSDMRICTECGGGKIVEGEVVRDKNCPACGGRGRQGYFNLVRPDEDSPAPTVTQTGGVVGAASITHPTEKRKFTIPELRRLSGFPDDFILTGSWSQQWERIGRAVPPPMMAAIAATIRDEILT